MAKTRLVIFLLSSLLFSTTLFAEIHALLGNGSKNMMLGGSSSLVASDAYSAQVNPATMTQLSRPTIGLGAAYDRVDLDRPSTYDRSDKLLPGEQNSYEGDVPRTFLGVLFPLFTDRLVFGLSGTFSTNRLARIYTLSEQDSHYLEYNTKISRPEISTALAYRFDHFSLGAGLIYSVKAEGIIQAGAAEDDVQSRLDIDLYPTYIPYGGLLYKNSWWGNQWSVGGFYRHRQDSDSRLHTSVDYDFGTLSTIPLTIDSTLIAFYHPASWGVGASLETSSNYNLFAAVVQQMWGSYRPPVVNVQIGSSDPIQRTPVRLEHTWNYAFGVEYREGMPVSAGGGETLFKVVPRLGVEYHQSALPERLQSLALLDSSKYFLTCGVGLRDGILKSGPYPVRLDAGVRYGKLRDQTLIAVNDQGVELERTNVGGNIFSTFVDLTLEY